MRLIELNYQSDQVELLGDYPLIPKMLVELN